MIKGFYKTKSINEKNGKPDVVAYMFNEEKGISQPGGALSEGVVLDFGKPGERYSFVVEQWISMTKEEYERFLGIE